MASVAFNLKEPKSKEETLVMAVFYYNSKRIRITTGIKIHPKLWNAKEQRVKETQTFIEHSEINASLDKLESKLKTTYRRLSNDGHKITPEILKREFEKQDEENNESEISFFGFIDELIKTSAKKYNTIRNYKQTLAKLKDYKKENRKQLDFENINLEFYNDFTKYLQEKDYSVNSIGGFVKNIKVFMHEATDRGLNKNLEYLNRKFKVVEENTDAIYLSEKEILKIYKKDLSTLGDIEQARDLFVIGCYTGLRFSDLGKINADNFIKKNTQIKVKTEKTGDTVVIPVHKFVKEILSKYKGQMPPTFNNVKLNEHLKEIGKIAEINEKVLISITKGGKRKQESFFKWELITTHTARRSFATNLFLADVPSITIMKITGHKTEKAFLKYIRLTQEQNANKLINHPFFN